MRLTDYTDFSLRTLIYVAVHPGELVTIQRIADAFSIPKNHLIKIVQKLGQAGFLHTVRGRAGGIELGRPAADINVGEVIRTMESDFNLVECFQGDDNHCVITRVCGLRGALSAALRAYFEVLDSYSLQDLVEKPAALSRALGADNTQLVPSVPIKRVSRKARTTPSVPGESGRT